jgi:hypothetical protein
MPQRGWFLLFSVPSTENNKKNNLCALCVLSEAGGELLQVYENAMSQTLNYLKATGLHSAILLNFGKEKLKYERLVH